MTDLTILNEIHKGVTMGMASLEEVSSKSNDKLFKDNLSYQYNLYQNTLNTVNKEFEKVGSIPEDTPMSQKFMGWSGIQFNTLNDTSNSKLSELLIQGYDMGIIKGVKLLNNSPEASKNVKNILNDFISLQENSIDQLKKFL
ncbi:MAG: hypothetical protein IKJ36_03605 [Clostridia bacterium]|nr:hypothetical protein [Clostridia bacterium]